MDSLTAAKAWLGNRYCLAVRVERIPHDRPLPWFLRADVKVRMVPL